jgi:hypothetical protein
METFNEKILENTKYVYDEDLWFFPLEIQLEIMCNWQSKINPYNKKLYYANPNFICKEHDEVV